MGHSITSTNSSNHYLKIQLLYTTMQLLVDTCSWMKLEELKHLNLFDSQLLYDYSDITITHAVLEEVRYFGLSGVEVERTTVQPIGNQRIYEEAKALELDEADASLLSRGNPEGEPILISEDGGLLEFARSYQFMHLQVIDLFAILCKNNLISKKELYRLTRKLRELRNITEKKQKQMKKILQSTD